MVGLIGCAREVGGLLKLGERGVVVFLSFPYCLPPVTR